MHRSPRAHGSAIVSASPPPTAPDTTISLLRSLQDDARLAHDHEQQVVAVVPRHAGMPAEAHSLASATELGGSPPRHHRPPPRALLCWRRSARRAGECLNASPSFNLLLTSVDMEAGTRCHRHRPGRRQRGARGRQQPGGGRSVQQMFHSASRGPLRQPEPPHHEGVAALHAEGPKDVSRR